MTRIEKAVKIVSDLYDFYRQIPKISRQDPVREEKHNEALQRTAQERAPLSPESPLARRR
jgi:hypothetical protein